MISKFKRRFEVKRTFLYPSVTPKKHDKTEQIRSLKMYSIIVVRMNGKRRRFIVWNGFVNGIISSVTRWMRRHDSLGFAVTRNYEPLFVRHSARRRTWKKIVIHKFACV